MKVVALISGGKDSCFNILKCQQHGHHVVALANLHPHERAPDDMDSFCFQTVGHQVLDAYAQCTGLPLFRLPTRAISGNRELVYETTASDEVEDLFRLLAFVKAQVPGIAGVSSGAIASDYQRNRVEHVCARLGLTSLSYLWHQPQQQLLQDMLDAGLQAVLVKVAALGLTPRHLGRTLADLQPHLERLAHEYGCNVCGEGGEYETLTLDSPTFLFGRIELEAWEARVTEDPVCAVAHLTPTAFRVVPKPASSSDGPREAGSDPCSVEADRSEGHALIVRVPEDFHPAGGASDAVADSAVHSSGGEPAAPDGVSGEGATVAAQASESQVSLSACVKASSGRLTSFQVAAWCAVGDVDEAAMFAAVTAVMSRLQEELKAHGASWRQALFVNLHLADMRLFTTANRAYCAIVPQSSAPARACVEISSIPPSRHLPGDVQPADLDSSTPIAVADILVAWDACSSNRHVMHVQSHSEWAPACIGPYSQATVYRGLLSMAGQIPLDPATMQLSRDPPVQRCFTSCKAVATALGAALPSCALSLLAYHTDRGRAASVAALVRDALRDNEERCLTDEEAECTADGDVVDSYLRSTQLPSSPGPLVLCVCVAGLPRSCTVELQPLCAVPGAAGGSVPAADATGDICADGFSSGLWTSSLKRRSWLANGTSPTAGSVCIDCIVATEVLLVAQLTSSFVEGRQLHIDGILDSCWTAVRECVEQVAPGRLGLQAIDMLRLFVDVEVVDCFRASFVEAHQAGVLLVPTHGLHNGHEQLAWAAIAMFTA